MIIEIRNFGPIDYLQFDLSKDLHLIYGKNAIGKSYATYCIYCILKTIKSKPIDSRYFYYINQDTDAEEIPAKFLKKLKDTKDKNIDITKDIKDAIEEALKVVLVKNLSNSLLNTFSSLKNLKNRYSNKNYELSLIISESEKITFTSNEEGVLDLNYDVEIEKHEIRIKNTKSTKFSLYTNDRMQFGQGSDTELIQRLVRYSYTKLSAVLSKLNYSIKDIYYLPASRSGLYQALNAFTPIIAELTQNRFFMQNKNIELPSLSEPLADYFIDLSTLDKKNSNKEFDNIVKILQTDILKGEVDYNDTTKRIVYRPNNIDLELNLSEASSMVSELSPLVLYFKHIINNKFSSTNRGESLFGHFFEASVSRRNKSSKNSDIIFIEEPEAHLHPEVQVRLMEIFSSLSALGLKIFVTSHSNYMFNKLNNLIINNQINSNSTSVYHLVSRENGTIQNEDMLVEEDGINDDNFAETAEKLYYERMQSLDKQNDR